MEQFTNRLTSVVSISRTGSSSSRTPFSDVGRSHPHPKTESYQIRSYNPLFVFGRRDVPPERLYKDMQLAEKGGIKSGFRINRSLQLPILQF